MTHVVQLHIALDTVLDVWKWVRNMYNYKFMEREAWARDLVHRAISEFELVMHLACKNSVNNVLLG